MNLSEVIKENATLEIMLLKEEQIKIKILSNITLNQLKPALEYSLRKNGLNANLTIGQYDNIIQESCNIKPDEIPIIFWELSNIKENILFEIETFDEKTFEIYLNKVKSELKIVFQNLKKSKIVIFNKFSHLLFSYSNLKETNFEIFTSKLNYYLNENLPTNFILIDINKPISQVSTLNSIDLRGFYLTKTLYTFTFLSCYSKFISPIIFALYGKSKKAIILDCDNTLWKGIVGEDGLSGISLSEKDKSGVYFKQLHFVLKKIALKGILLGICSKNNYKDVEDVFNSREDFILNTSDFVIKKINWIDKATNLKKISSELNIGIDSLVFIDDSKFEINLINEVMPSVKTIQVPENLYEYPILLLNSLDLFFSLSSSNEDKNRTEMYISNELRQKDKNNFGDFESYLKSLDILLTISNKDKKAIDRIVQLSQKTNQFNLTTTRYTNNEIEYFFQSIEHDIFTLNVSDKYGESGITGLCIVKYDHDNAYIDTLLLSCRILGRNIEKVFLFQILQMIKTKNKKNIFSKYIKTLKNNQVQDFYENSNFELISQTGNTKEYLINAQTDLNNNINYINVIWNQN
jgi:FkbH-like protein